MNKSSIVIGILSILFYLLFLFLYIQDIIDEFLFLIILLMSLIILLVSLIIMLFIYVVFRKKYVAKKKIAIATLIIFVLFCYEVPLIGYYTSPTHLAYAYSKPTEALKGTGIYSIGVDQFSLNNGKSKQAVEELLTKQHVDVLSVIEVNNKTIYGIKNRQILKWLHLLKEHSPEETRENVALYLGREDEWLKTFLGRPNIEGDSSGLSLVLTGLIKQGDFQNQIPIAVTGSINENGKVFGVVNIKEKIQITEKIGIPFMIIPSENAEEVAEIQKELKANVEIFDVSHVDEAVQLIRDLNEKR
ncbi:S16 family serine protease [Lysinibacillus telephonicus]|uniref:S16 family serine protease n=1 Tax=Lysinibacillus telephonicus TaxID=1714840 RepID=UPI003B9F5712